ncbi:MAG TPA: sigma 54-interacting transcriptional regulator [Terriglobia bacterium]|nr:sigma 54-interacting transcriptional regulator [Terriglobia bacterium]
MRPVSLTDDSKKANAPVILEVAKAISAHLELSDVLGALVTTLKPLVQFDSIGIVVREGEYAKLHSLHIEGLHREGHESVQSMLERKASDLQIEPLQARIPISKHHMSAIIDSGEPYVCSDVETQRRFLRDDDFLKYGIHSYVALPLMKHGELIGVVDFLSLKTRSFTETEVQLLQDVSDMVSIAVSNALAYEQINVLKEQLQIENRLLRDDQRSIYEEIVGSSTSLQKVLIAIDKVARTDSTVLVTGETGTGKELVAHAIHRRSPRSNRALVKVNCAALPAELIASELFGHEKGAFTGALNQRVGRFEAANGGTIFLDEIGELTSEMQISLLRVLQEKEFERVGGNRTIRTDVRVIAATNRNLEREVADGRFRMDLYYRLNVFPVHVPSLRERSDDIPILVDYFAARLASRMGKRIREIDKQTLDTMQRYLWPGNIRELQNVIERGVILADGEVFRLEPGTLTQEFPSGFSTSSDSATPHGDQKTEIEAVLRETRGRISGPDGAAARLGLPASTLESRIRALRINKHQFR